MRFDFGVKSGYSSKIHQTMGRKRSGFEIRKAEKRALGVDDELD